MLTLYAVDNLLLSGGRDNLIRVWDLETMCFRRTLHGHKDDVLAISGVRLPSEPPRLFRLDSLDSMEFSPHVSPCSLIGKCISLTGLDTLH